MAKKHTENRQETTTLPQNGAPRTFLLNLDDFRKHLKQLSADCGGNAELGRRLGVTGQYIDMQINGKRTPGPKMLAAIGARRRVMIEIDVEDADVYRD